MRKSARSAGVRPRLQELPADEVKAMALSALTSADNQLHALRMLVQNRTWAALEQGWKDFDLLTTVASVPIADLCHRAKGLHHRPPRGRA